jgi:RNA polymerase sigma factor (sigma-70 family)
MRYTTGTSSTLIERIRNPEDEDAWERFARFYQPLILRFARGQGCDAHMCRDVAQETLVDLLSIMPRFTYNRGHGRFRGFLYEVVRRRVMAAFRQRRRYASVEAGEEGTPWPALATQPEISQEVWDQEWQRQLFLEALARLRARVQPSSYAAFHDYTVLGEAADSVCQRFSLTPNALYQIRHRLLATLKQIATEIEAELDDTPG